MLTACLIIKNEEKHIGSCLKKLPKFIDEIVVVDTGSTDKTLEILKDFDVSIYHFDWCDDFSKARNFATSKAKNDWVLVLDADEYIYDFDEKYILNFIKSDNDTMVGQIKIKSFIGDGTDFSYSNVSRIYNKNYYHFVSKLHEFLTVSKMGYKLETTTLPLAVDHYGYTTEDINTKGKADFYINILNKQLEVSFEPYYVYHLAVCYSNIFEYEKCLTEIDKIIDLPAVISSTYFNKVVSLKIKALLSLEKIDKALEMEKYFDNCRDNDSYLYMLALVYRYVNQSEDALNIYEYLYQKEDLQINIETVIYAIADVFYSYQLYTEAKEWFLKLEQTDKIKEQIKLCDDKAKNEDNSQI